MTAKVISFINMKGGVGKTTLLFELTHFINQKFLKSDGTPFKILLIDTDPQSNLTQREQERFSVYNQLPSDDIIFGNKSIQRLFDSDMPSSQSRGKNEVVFELKDDLHLIPGELKTVFLERTQAGKGVILRNFIIDNDLKSQYDLIFIDCPPTYSLYTELSMLISDFYFIPTLPDAYSILGISLLEDVVDDLKTIHRNDVFQNSTGPELLGIVLNNVRQDNRKAVGWAKTVREAYSDSVFKNQIPYKSKIAGSTLERSAADTKDTKVIEIISNVASEFLERLKISYKQKKD